MRLPETGKRKYGFDVLKGRNQLYHVHALAFLEGAVRGLGERLFHCSEVSCSRPDMTVLISMVGILWT